MTNAAHKIQTPCPKSTRIPVRVKLVACPSCTIAVHIALVTSNANVAMVDKKAAARNVNVLLIIPLLTIVSKTPCVS